jgi:peptidoglycan/LPS O-acetylase OafA/YrhL
VLRGSVASSPLELSSKPLELSSKLRLPALDGVRGLAILVIVHNAALFPDTGPGVVRLASIVAGASWVGVDLFFVLSGFLITGILLDHRGEDDYFRSFFLRRMLRIFPLYYATLFVAFAVLPQLTHIAHLAPVARLAPDGRNQIWLWTYLDNWTGPLGRDTPAFPHFWSLAVEEQFYLLWPFVVWLLAPRRLLAACAGLTVVALLARVGLRLAGADHQLAYEWTVCRMDALAIGAVVAGLLRRPDFRAWADAHRSRLAGAALALFVAGLLLTRGYPRVSFRSQSFGYSLLDVTFGVFILVAVVQDLRGRGALRRMLATRPLRSIGTVSYGMYVFHTPIKQFAEAHLVSSRLAHPGAVGPAWGLAYLVAITAGSYVAALASYHLFEKRFLALRGRVIRRPRTAEVEAEANAA